MTGQKETVYTGIFRFTEMCERWNDEPVRRNKMYVRNTPLSRFEHTESCPGRGGFESNADKDKILPGLVLSHPERLVRRVNNAHIRAPGPALLQASCASCALRTSPIEFASGDAHHVPEGRDNGSRTGGKLDNRVYKRIRRHANRTPGTGYEPEVPGEKVTQSITGDCHCVRSAHFHECQSGRGTQLGYSVGQTPDVLSVSELPQVHYSSSPATSSASRAEVSLASSSSMR